MRFKNRSDLAALVGAVLLLALAISLGRLRSPDVVAAAVSPTPVENLPWRVVVLNSYSFLSPADVLGHEAMRAAFAAGASRPVELRHETLDARVTGSELEPEYLALLRRKYRDLKTDLVMVESGALDFAERHHSRLWPGAPVIFYGAEDALFRNRTYHPGFTGVFLRLDPAGTLDLAMRLQPRARRVVVVNGTAVYNRRWTTVIAALLSRYEGRFETVYLTDLPLPQILAELARQPRDAIVLFAGMLRDSAGRTYVARDVVPRIAEASSAPVYGFWETFLGRGIVGGVMPSLETHGRQAAELALRVLAGEHADSIAPYPGPPGAVTVDWRQLRRWGMGEDRLPPGAIVLFRSPSLWDSYRWHIAGAAVIIMIEGGLVALLLVQRRLRRQAETAVARHRVELAHASRLAVAGELTSVVAHEINQPLGAILMNAEAAEMILDAGSGGLDDVRQILADIRRDDLRASQVVGRLREMLARRDETERQALDLNEVVSSVLQLLGPYVKHGGVVVKTEFEPALPAVRGDRVHLQQVLLNLLLNAMEAMVDTPPSERRLTMRTVRNGSGVEVVVTDAGHGIPPEWLPRLFDSFFTTKRDGMGLGLSIARSIVHLHGGRISAENNPSGGATFRFTLPAEPVA